MTIEICNKCKQPLGEKDYFRFKIDGFHSAGNFINDISFWDGPDIGLNNFCLCPVCMKRFSEFVQRGQE